MKWKVHRGCVGEPFQDIGMFVRGVIVDDGVNELAAWHGTVDGGEKSDELLMPMLVHATPDHGSVEDVQGGKERRRAVAFVIMGHGPAFARFQRQARLGPIESLNLALLVDGDDHGVSWRVHVETDDVLDLLGEFRIVGALEGAKPMRLQANGLPQRWTARSRRRPPWPWRGRSNAWFRPVARNRSAPALSRPRWSKAALCLACVSCRAGGCLALPRRSALPAPNGRAADSRRAERLPATGKRAAEKENDARPLHMFERTITVAGNGEQTLAIFGGDDHIDSLGHAARLAHPAKFVNPLSVSVH